MSTIGEFQGLKTAYVHDWLTVPGGAEEVLRQMQACIPADIWTGQYNAEKFPWVAEMGLKVHPHWISGLPLSKSKHYVYAPVLADVYRSMDLSEADLILGASHSFAHGIRPRKDAVFFCCYHTPARALWAPEIDNRAGSGFLRGQIIKRLKRLDMIASKNPTYIVANSKTIKERVERVYRRPVDGVLYPGVDVDKFSAVKRISEDEGYLVYGRQIAYKRTDLAIEAAKRLGFKLNVVGNGPMLAEWKALAVGYPNIVFHGRLSDADLMTLMGRSRGYLFPAYEDFGIVVVEAQAAGLPVVAYRQGGASETVLPETGVFMDEQTPDSLCEAITAFEQRTFDPEVARNNSLRFSIQTFNLAFTDYAARAIERGPRRNSF
jgi:glycosyltransferase involved in cell wall biosynthesis